MVSLRLSWPASSSYRLSLAKLFLSLGLVLTKIKVSLGSCAKLNNTFPPHPAFPYNSLSWAWDSQKQFWHVQILSLGDISNHIPRIRK